ncbi:MAG TPA: hypothetical protein VFT22_13285 [Kofleriaceae bacterium]|nr:hypothetical protein [Kofleriaceae bacterium]
MSEAPPSWDDLRQIADEIQLKIHLAEMDARDRWHAILPRLTDLEHKLERAGGTVGDSVKHELSEIGAALRHLREDVVMRAHDDFLGGW